MKMPYITRPNSWVSQDAAATTQLTYALQLNPAPLTVSISGRDPILGSLEFVITNPTASAISLNSVAFTIQVGTTGSNLTTSTANVGTSVSDSTNWLIQSPGTITSGPAIYTLSPQSGSSVSVAAGASIVVEIYNFSTVENPGNTTINVKESVGSTISFTSFLVTTFPSGFYFNGLSATVENGSQLVPAAQVATGATVTLVWNSSVVDLASFTIYYSNAAQGQQSATPSDTGLWTSGPLSADTVFTIVVTVSIAGGTPLTAALSTAVSVQNPSLIAASITAATAAVNGPLTVTGATQANAITATGVTVNGPVSAGNISASGTLAVPGQSNLGTVGVSGNLTVTGNGTLGSANVSGALQAGSLSAGSASISSATINGLSASGGRVSLISGAQAINPGTSWGSPAGFTAPTDGFAIGVIGYPNSSSPGCMCYGYGQSIGVTVFATGGNVGFFGPGWSNYMSMNPNSFVLPVPAGNNFYIAVQQGSGGQQADAPYWYYWVPMGAGTVGSTVTQLDKPGPDFVQPAPIAADQRHDFGEKFIEALEELVGKKIDGKMRKKLLGGS
jgi:hypothetical protein